MLATGGERSDFGEAVESLAQGITKSTSAHEEDGAHGDRHSAVLQRSRRMLHCRGVRVNDRGGRGTAAAIARVRVGVASRAALPVAAWRQLGWPRPGSARAGARRVFFCHRHAVQQAWWRTMVNSYPPTL